MSETSFGCSHELKAKLKELKSWERQSLEGVVWDLIHGHRSKKVKKTAKKKVKKKTRRKKK